MTDENNNAPADDIEAAAAAAADTAAANPDAPRDDAPPEAPPEPTAEEKAAADAAAAEAAKPAAKKKARKADKGAKPNRHVKAVQRKQKADKARNTAEPTEPTEEEQAAAAAHREKIDGILDTMAKAVADEDADEYDKCVDELAEHAKPGDVKDAAQACLEEADKLEKRVGLMRKMHGDLVTTQPNDDGRDHAHRVKDMQARGKEIREKRARDRLTLLAKGAGKSPLDLAHATQQRKSPADADAPPATE